MAAPTPLPETYLACIDSIFTIGADPNTSTLAILDGGYTLAFGVDEMTNNESGGAYEDVKTYKTMDGQFTGAWIAGTPPVFQAGDIFPIVVDSPDGPYLACNARFNGVQLPMLTANAGVKYQFTIKNQGAITTIRPAPG